MSLRDIAKPARRSCTSVALFGGTTGCMPTKTLVASAYAAHLARRAAEFGTLLGSAWAIDTVSARALTVRMSRATPPTA